MTDDRFTHIAAPLLILAATAGILFASVHAAVRDLPLPAYASHSKVVVVVAKHAPAPSRLTTAAVASRHG